MSETLNLASQVLRAICSVAHAIDTNRTASRLACVYFSLEHLDRIAIAATDGRLVAEERITLSEPDNQIIELQKTGVKWLLRVESVLPVLRDLLRTTTRKKARATIGLYANSPSTLSFFNEVDGASIHVATLPELYVTYETVLNQTAPPAPGTNLASFAFDAALLNRAAAVLREDGVSETLLRFDTRQRGTLVTRLNDTRDRRVLLMPIKLP